MSQEVAQIHFKVVSVALVATVSVAQEEPEQVVGIRLPEPLVAHHLAISKYRIVNGIRFSHSKRRRSRKRRELNQVLIIFVHS